MMAASGNPLVSVVITAYNAEKYICETLSSVRAQIYRPIQVIVVDDGSTDATADLVKMHFPEAMYIYQPNSGQPCARNTGIRAAEGDYIAFVDSDDLWFPRKIASQMEQLLRHSAAWCYCDCLYFRGDLQHTLYRYSALVRPHRGSVLKPLVLGNFISSPTPIIRRDALMHLGLWDENVAIAEDWNMWLKLAAQYSIEYVDEPLAAYRLHSDNMLRATSIENILRSNLDVLSAGLRLLDGHSYRFEKKARANLYFKVGLIYLKRGDEGEGRRMIFRALKNNPSQPRFYAYLAFALLPRPIVNTANRLRHWYLRALRATRPTSQLT